MTVLLEEEEVGGGAFSATATLESAEGAAGSWKVIDDADADVMTSSARAIPLAAAAGDPTVDESSKGSGEGETTSATHEDMAVERAAWLAEDGWMADLSARVGSGELLAGTADIRAMEM